MMQWKMAVLTAVATATMASGAIQPRTGVGSNGMVPNPNGTSAHIAATVETGTTRLEPVCLPGYPCGVGGTIAMNTVTPTLNPVCLPGYPCGSGGTIAMKTAMPTLNPVCLPGYPCGSGGTNSHEGRNCSYSPFLVARLPVRQWALEQQ